MIKSFCCLRVVAFTPKLDPAESALLYDENNELVKKIIIMAQCLSPSDKAITESLQINGNRFFLRVWKSPGVKSIGGIAGHECMAQITFSPNMTEIAFILAERSIDGHNSRELRIPLF